MKEISSSIKNVITGAVDSVRGAIDTVTQPAADMLYIRNKNNAIKKILQEANERLDPARTALNAKVEALGKIKSEVIHSSLSEFIAFHEQIQHFSFERDAYTSKENDFSVTKKSFHDFKTTIVSYKQILKDGAVGAVGGLATASAVYGGIGLFGIASTGTAIGALHGIAASNAILAWLGGGAIAVGGGGIALGTVVLGGIITIPAIAYMAYKGKFDFSDKKEEVDHYYQEAVEYSKKVDDAIETFQAIETLIENVTKLINNYSTLCLQTNKQTLNILNHVGNNFKKYSDEQKALIVHNITIAQRLTSLINLSLMNEEGVLNKEAISVIQSVNEAYVQDKAYCFTDFKKKSILERFKQFFSTLG